MPRKLRLVRDVRHDRERAASSSEEQYRYPAQDEVWEVSCEPDWEDEKPTLTNNRLRAS